MSKDVQVVRIYISEDAKDKKENLYKEIFSLLHDRLHVCGVTVFRGIVGFGKNGEVHSADLLRLNVSLPLVIEFFDEPKVVEGALKLLEPHIEAGHMLTWRATCI